MEDKDLGLKEGEKAPEKQPDSEKQPAGSEALKTPETSDEKAERLLKDGTSPTKEIKVKKTTYDEKSEKARMYEAHAPLLDKVLENPELVESLLNKGEGMNERLSQLEEDRKAEKRAEVKTALTDALSKWPDFEKRWREVQPVADALVKSGVKYADALRRAYFSVDPDAAAAEKERLAKEGVNDLGVFSSNPAHSAKPAQIKDEPKLTDGQRTIFNVLRNFSHMPKTEAEYANLLNRHDSWLKEKGFYREE